MKLLLPSTSAQEISVLPRDPDTITGLSLVITDEASGVSETLTPDAWRDGDLVILSVAYSILKEHRLYNIEVTAYGDLWWRGRARCTSQSDKTVKHKLNSVADSSTVVMDSDEDYEIIL